MVEKQTRQNPIQSLTEKFIQFKGRQPIKGEMFPIRLEEGNDTSPSIWYYFTGEEWREMRSDMKVLQGWGYKTFEDRVKGYKGEHESLCSVVIMHLKNQIRDHKKPHITLQYGMVRLLEGDIKRCNLLLDEVLAKIKEGKLK